jgi:FtsP/CotA-like multicopper oxidase with cupredoxin domain
VATEFSRRRFLGALGSTAGFAFLNSAYAQPLSSLLQQSQQANGSLAAPTTLRAVTRTLEINGKPASVMGLLQANGTQGITSTVNQLFRVVLENQLPVPTAIHWHGLHPPNNQDGVPGVTQPVIRPDASTEYDFPLIPAGTHWMHSHEGLQEAYLLAAPLIVHDPADRSDEQEVVIMLGDFSFTPPNEVLAKLRARRPAPTASGGMKMGQPDADDWDYDAYLANDRTLADPEVVRVESNGRVRLRIINGSSGTNYFIDLGNLNGELIATDGMPIKPIQGSRFPLAIAQRIDVRVQIPKDGGAFPIIGLRELSAEQTGIILATLGAKIKRVPVKSSSPTGLLSLAMEREFVAANPLVPKASASTNILRLQGNMAGYEWLINGRAFDVNNPGKEKPQVHVKAGERVTIKFVNETGMGHPMHLHGHSFQVIAINDVAMNGALRDTVLVPARTNVTVAFDANNPGLWYVHCHVLWHLAAGMATLVQYEA